jgi:hypothetical protein
MERDPRDPDEHEVQQPLPGEHRHDLPDAERPPEITVEFGELRLIPPEGESWGEWVITRGIEAAERESHPVDNRTAHYIAAFLGDAANPALRNLARAGIVDGPGAQEELVGQFLRQTAQVRTWIDRLAEYCMHREDRGPIDDWQHDIVRQDRLEAEWLRRERIFDRIDELFQSVPPPQRLGNGADPGWHGLVRHEGRPGGWIVSEGAPGVRRVWESDSDNELEAAYVALVRAQQQWILETFGDPRSAHEPGHHEEWRDTPSDPSAAPDG